MMRLDKKYLMRELETSRERCRVAEAERDRLQGRTMELERHREELMDKMYQARESIAGMSRAQGIGSLEAMKASLDEALRSKAELQQMHDKLRLDSQESLLLLEKERLQSEAVLAARSFEFERLGATFEESLEQLKATKNDLALSLKKNKLIKQEYDALKTERDVTVSNLQSRISATADKLHVYQQLEHDLDLAILNAGRDTQEDMSGPLTLSQLNGSSESITVRSSSGRTNLMGIDRILESVSSTLPAANRRRLQQSILLAQQLVEKQKQLERSDAALMTTQKLCDDLKARLAASVSELEAMSQPQHYLISTLRTKDEQLSSCRHRISTLELSLDQRESECQNLRRMNEEMANDLSRLTQQRTAMRQLKQMLLEKRDQILQQREERQESPHLSLTPSTPK